MKMFKKLIGATVISLALLTTGCLSSDSDVASRNLSTAAENFEIDRRIVFYNGITGEYMLTIEGRCSIDNQKGLPNAISVTCKVGDDLYKKHFLGLSDNVTYFVEQLEGKGVSVYHYRVIFKPQTIIPDIDIKVDVIELVIDTNDA